MTYLPTHLQTNICRDGRWHMDYNTATGRWTAWQVTPYGIATWSYGDSGDALHAAELLNRQQESEAVS